MAQNLQLLKRRIKTAKNIAQIAKAMEMISASKIKKAQVAVENNKPYAEKITSLTESILQHTDISTFTHPYMMRNESKNTLLIILSPDKGLSGSLTTNLFKKILEVDSKNTKIVTVGKKATQFCQRLESELLASFEMGTTLPPYQAIFKILEIINNQINNNEVSEVKILYSAFNSVFSQEPTIKTILPIQKPVEEQDNLPYLFEPNAQVLLSEILPYYIEVSLYAILVEAFTAEQAARMMAMQNAKNNALDIADYLTLSYNKSRQEKITNELLSLANNN